MSGYVLYELPHQHVHVITPMVAKDEYRLLVSILHVRVGMSNTSYMCDWSHGIKWDVVLSPRYYLLSGCGRMWSTFTTSFSHYLQEVSKTTNA